MKIIRKSTKINTFHQKCVKTIKLIWVVPYEFLMDFFSISAEKMSCNKLLNHANVESNSKRKRSVEYEIRKACMNGNTEKAIEYLSESEVLNIDELNRTKVLFHAVKSGEVTLVKRLLEIGCNVEIKNEMNQTPLHLASGNGHFQIVKLLLDYNAELDNEDIFHETALENAAINGNLSIVDLLLANAQPIEAKIHKACKEENTEEVVLLMNSKIAINIDDINQKKTLLVAVGNQNETIVGEFLKMDVDVNILNEDGLTPLQIATDDGSMTIVEELLKHGAKVNVLDSDGLSSLFVAIVSENFQVAELLIKHGAQYHGYTDADVSSSLHGASYEGCYEVCKVLLENGANVDGLLAETVKPLHSAAENGHLDIVELLVKHGANVNILDEFNITPFNGAVRNNCATIVKRFFELGTNLDLNIRNIDGNTAFEDAVDSRKRFGRVGKLMIFQEHIKYH